MAKTEITRLRIVLTPRVKEEPRRCERMRCAGFPGPFAFGE
jgi:hypothetical protein